jgi:nucleotide-binding universal stress UspA family protein
VARIVRVPDSHEEVAVSYVLVGVDGSDASRGALVWAVDAGRAFELPVRVVHGYVQDRDVATAPAAMRGATVRTAEPAPSGPRRHDQALVRLRTMVADVLGTAPDDALELLVVDGRPSDLLLEHAHGAAMVVVGSRGVGGLRGRLLGSVSQRLTHEAPCPVVVIRDRDG